MPSNAHYRTSVLFPFLGMWWPYTLGGVLRLAGRDLTDTITTNGHWVIESASHYVRDATLGEDRSHMHTGHAPEVLVALRNGLLAPWRRAGWTNMAAAVRATGASVAAALACIGARVTLT